MSTIESRTFFIRPDSTVSTIIRNQSSGLINTPETSNPVPGDDAKELIQKNKSALDRITNDISRFAAKEDADRAFELRLAQSSGRKGSMIDTYA